MARSRRSQSDLEKAHLDLGQEVPLFTQMAVGTPVYAIIRARCVSSVPGSHMAVLESLCAQLTEMQLCNCSSPALNRPALLPLNAGWEGG